jgi:hypothetical protein
MRFSDEAAAMSRPATGGAKFLQLFFEKILPKNQVMSGQSYPNTTARQRDPS